MLFLEVYRPNCQAASGSSEHKWLNHVARLGQYHLLFEECIGALCSRDIVPVNPWTE